MIMEIQAINKNDGCFDEEDEKLLEAFSSQAQISIQNSNNYSALQEMKKLLESHVVVNDDDCVLIFNSGGGFLYVSKVRTKVTVNFDLLLNSILSITAQ
jgi:hypothetical protein